MRAERLTVVTDPLRGGVLTLRRSGVLALAAFAALLTLLLPAPAAARPAAVAGGSVASTGGPGSSVGSSHTGRREHRGGHQHSSLSAGTSWSGPVVSAAAPAEPVAVAGGPHGAGPGLIAALPASGPAHVRHLVSAQSSAPGDRLLSTPVRSAGSRGPPTA